MERKTNNFISILPLFVTIIIAIFGNYIITTNKVSATDAKVEIYQQQIDGLSKKMDKLNDSQFFVSSQIALIQNLTKAMNTMR